MTSKTLTQDAPIFAYKGFGPDWKCRGYQFEVGKTYEHDGPVVHCESGFHACTNPLDVWNHYGLDGSKFAVVELSGVISHPDYGDSKVAAGTITIKAELKLPEVISAAIRWITDACTEGAAESGDYSKLASSGRYSQLASSGCYSQLASSGDSSYLASSGRSSQLASSGDSSQLASSGDSSYLASSGRSSQLASSGDSSHLASSGDSSQLASSGCYSRLASSGVSSIACSAAPFCKAKAGSNGAIVLTRWVEYENRYRVTVGYVGENGIAADTWYELDSAGVMVEVSALEDRS